MNEYRITLTVQRTGESAPQDVPNPARAAVDPTRPASWDLRSAAQYVYAISNSLPAGSAVCIKIDVLPPSGPWGDVDPPLPVEVGQDGPWTITRTLKGHRFTVTLSLDAKSGDTHVTFHRDGRLVGGTTWHDGFSAFSPLLLPEIAASEEVYAELAELVRERRRLANAIALARANGDESMEALASQALSRFDLKSEGERGGEST